MICDGCRADTTYPEEYLDAARIPKDFSSRARFQKGQGCDACNGTGYSGRQGIYKVMAMLAGLRKLVMRGAGTDKIRNLAIRESMLTLRDDGLKKVEGEITTPEGGWSRRLPSSSERDARVDRRPGPIYR